ncbi:unnamed protein product [Sphacelaria rigidula]
MARNDGNTPSSEERLDGLTNQMESMMSLFSGQFNTLTEMVKYVQSTQTVIQGRVDGIQGRESGGARWSGVVESEEDQATQQHRAGSAANHSSPQGRRHSREG